MLRASVAGAVKNAAAVRAVPVLPATVLGVQPPAVDESLRVGRLVVTMAYEEAQANAWVARRLLGRQASARFEATGAMPGEDEWLAPQECKAHLPVRRGRGVRPGLQAEVAASSRRACDAPALVGFDSEDTPHFLRQGPMDGLALVQVSCGDSVLLWPARKSRPLPALLNAVLESEVLLKVGVGIADDVEALETDTGTRCRYAMELSMPHTVGLLAGVLDEHTHDVAGVLSVGSSQQLPLELRTWRPKGGAWGADGASRRQRGRRPSAGRGGLAGLPHVAETLERLDLIRGVNKVGLSRLSEHWCGVRSWKRSSLQMSDWGSLPLKSRQLQYAALDAWAGAAIAGAMAADGALDVGLARALAEPASMTPPKI